METGRAKETYNVTGWKSWQWELGMRLLVIDGCESKLSIAEDC